MTHGTVGFRERGAVAVVVGVIFSLGVSVPAMAQRPHYSIGVSSSAYTDAATPDVQYSDGVATPIGSRKLPPDAGIHTSRSYVSFDVARAQVNRARLSKAVLVGREAEVNDCTAPRDVQVQATEPVTRATTWATPPVTSGPTVKAVAMHDGCPSWRLEWDVTRILDRALKQGVPVVWLEMRASKAQEGKPRFGRTVETQFMTLDVTLTNQPPRKPVPSAPCGDMIARESFSVQADADDPDEDPADDLSWEFEYSSTDEPTQRIPLPSDRSYSTVPASTLADGRYGWRARAFDGREYSPWSDPCYFGVDRTAPTTAPTAASPEFPENSPEPTGQAYQQAMFLFTANGVADVVKFNYEYPYGGGTVAADAPGGAAALQLYFTQAGVQTLSVWGIDRAGNQSPERKYVVNVRSAF